MQYITHIKLVEDDSDENIWQTTDFLPKVEDIEKGFRLMWKRDINFFPEGRMYFDPLQLRLYSEDHNTSFEVVSITEVETKKAIWVSPNFKTNLEYFSDLSYIKESAKNLVKELVEANK